MNLTSRALSPRQARILPLHHARHHGTIPVSKGPLKIDHRQRLTRFWIPQATLPLKNESQGPSPADTNDLLVRAGYFRQAYAGIFHMLPLGLRVQSKIEALVDKHMLSLGASKVSLSAISSQALWKQSGRFRKDGEFFTFQDRKLGKWILAPTHEEEITTLVKNVGHSSNQLPIRAYQIGRKYRDEKRPRGGLLRGREFIMKDLYTFDRSEAEAHVTYDQVRQAYTNLFDELKLPYIEARADSGNMGGSLSHEFHFPSSLGEDHLISCSHCGFAKNEEFVPNFEVGEDQKNHIDQDFEHLIEKTYFNSEGTIAARVFARSASPDVEVNPYTVRAALDPHFSIDTGIENPDAEFVKRQSTTSNEGNVKTTAVYYLFDHTFDRRAIEQILEPHRAWHEKNGIQSHSTAILRDDTYQNHLLKKRTGDPCPECGSGSLTVQKAIEVGHTFHLGTRYSSKLDLHVPGNKNALVSMGCHGIGISRLIAAAASALSDARGLIWPRKIAPFEVLLVLNTKQTDFAESVEIGHQIYDSLATDHVDVLIDDRLEEAFGWKLKDADLIGYPVVVVLGKGWLKNKKVEIQCRRLNIKEEVTLDLVCARVKELLNQL